MTNNLIKQLLKNSNEKLSSKQKIEKIEYHFAEILKILGLDLTNSSLKNTPMRVAKMYVNEIFYGLDEKNSPNICFFDDTGTEEQKMVLVKNICVNSTCEHHFLPMIGKAHVAYIPNKKIIGLSKINRIVDFFAKKPQLQERLTSEIAIYLNSILNTDDIAVYTHVQHLCVTMRGIKDYGSKTASSHFKGKFNLDPDLRKEFLMQIIEN